MNYADLLELEWVCVHCQESLADIEKVTSHTWIPDDGDTHLVTSHVAEGFCRNCDWRVNSMPEYESTPVDGSDSPNIFYHVPLSSRTCPLRKRPGNSSTQTQTGEVHNG